MLDTNNNQKVLANKLEIFWCAGNDVFNQPPGKAQAVMLIHKTTPI